MGDFYAKALEALKSLSGWIFLLLAVAMGLILWLPIQPSALDPLRQSWGGWILAAGIIFACLTIARIAQSATAAIASMINRRVAARQARAAQEIADRAEAARLAQIEQEKEEAEREVLAYLDTLSDAERKGLAWFLENNARTTTGALSDPTLGMLRAKGLAVPHEGQFHRLEWPHTIPEYVWVELKRREGEFLQSAKKTRR